MLCSACWWFFLLQKRRSQRLVFCGGRCLSHFPYAGLAIYVGTTYTIFLASFTAGQKVFIIPTIVYPPFSTTSASYCDVWNVESQKILRVRETDFSSLERCCQIIKKSVCPNNELGATFLFDAAPQNLHTMSNFRLLIISTLIIVLIRKRKNRCNFEQRATRFFCHCILGHACLTPLFNLWRLGNLRCLPKKRSSLHRKKCVVDYQVSILRLAPFCKYPSLILGSRARVSALKRSSAPPCSSSFPLLLLICLNLKTRPGITDTFRLVSRAHSAQGIY